MNIRTFDLERIQSLYENTVPYNLTESGFHPFTLKELLSSEQRSVLDDMVLGYGQTNGSIPLRKRIADLYTDLNEDKVLVTNGSSEANYVACHTLLEDNDEVVMMVPNYMQIWGIVEELGAIPKAFHLKEEQQWAPDLEELKNLVNNKTRMIAICNPNNPTGYILTKDEMEKIVDIADEVGAWIYCDEIYRGAEVNNIETASFIGMYDKVLVTGGLSKAYALPGLRLGWLAGDKETIANAWAYHDYTSITSGLLSQKIAEFALEPKMRAKILNRNRNLLRANLDVIQKWVDKQDGKFEFVPPQGGGMAFMSYDIDINSNEFSTMLREEHGLFIVAGDWFGMDGYVRIGIGGETEKLVEELELFQIALSQIQDHNDSDTL